MNNNKYKTNYQRRNYKNGITLIEILVSIAIIMIMLATISVVFLDKKDEISLSLFRNQLIGDLRFAQVKSMNSVHNFGIHIEATNKYFLFKDINENNSFDGGEKIKYIDLPVGAIFISPSIKSNIIFGKDGSPLFNGIRQDIDVIIRDDVITKNVLINSKGLIN